MVLTIKDRKIFDDKKNKMQLRLVEMVKIKGANLVEYMIPMAVVGLVVGLGIYALFMDGKLSKFVALSGGGKAEATNQKILLGDDKPGKPLAWKREPTISCNGGSCTIDYGEFVLSGVPDNFNDFVETHGASGGTDKLSVLLYQIAEQLEKEGKTNEAIEVKKLASMGHNIAQIQNYFEKDINSCNGDSACLMDMRNRHDTVVINSVDGYDDRFYGFPSGMTGLKLNDAGFLGYARYCKSNDPALYQDWLNQGFINFQYIEQLDRVQNISNINDKMKGVISELSWDIGAMGGDFEANLESIYTPDPVVNIDFFDTLTGEKKVEGTRNQDPVGNLGLFNSYKASKVTNLDSSLICAAGAYRDTGKRCH